MLILQCIVEMVSRAVSSLQPEMIRRAFTATGIIGESVPNNQSVLNDMLRNIVSAPDAKGFDEAVTLAEDVDV